MQQKQQRGIKQILLAQQLVAACQTMQGEFQSVAFEHQPAPWTPGWQPPKLNRQLNLTMENLKEIQGHFDAVADIIASAETFTTETQVPGNSA